MKKTLMFIFLFLFSSCFVNALEICTPSDEYLKYMSLSDEEKALYTEPSYCKELVEEGSNNIILSFFKKFNSTISASKNDSSYNAYNEGLITSPKAQGNLGTCWAFSSISSVESNAIKNRLGTYDFSESHMIYSVLSAGYKDDEGKKGKYLTENFDGGKVTYAASYYFNNYGQLNESEMPYRDSMTKINSSEYKQGRKMISLGGFSLANIGNYGVCSTDEISYIKKQIINYGSVQASMFMNENLFINGNKEYYLATTSNSALPNHGINIIGWDDNISASNFNGATRNGAWLIKNSWGPNWSNDGLFYISYDDHFICKNTATFYDVSTTTFDNTYASADMLGVPTFTFSNNFFTSARFVKKTANVENIKRVSFPVAEDAFYYVYLVSDNNLNNQSAWKQLATGSSDSYGIKSVNLTNVSVSNNFTIVVKYSSEKDTSIFTMCNNSGDTSKMTFSSGTNYYSLSGSNWSDMSNIIIDSTKISCEPNIYVYTDNTSTSVTPSNPPAVTTNEIKINSITSSGDDYIVSITNSNVSTSTISYKITNNSNSNMTSHFVITPNYNTNKITIKPDNTLSGKFNFIITYGSKEVSASFELKEGILSSDSSFANISSNNIIINLSNNNSITLGLLINKLKVKNSNFDVYNANGIKITNQTDKITTNSFIKLNNNTYLLIIKGDVNCDGKVSALDYIEIRKHIMGSTITDRGKILASDLDSNNKISTLDYLEIRKVLMR